MWKIWIVYSDVNILKLANEKANDGLELPGAAVPTEYSGKWSPHEEEQTWMTEGDQSWNVVPWL